MPTIGATRPETLPTFRRKGRTWLAHDAFVQMAEPLMLEIQRRLTPQVTWRRTLNRHQNSYLLPFHGAGETWLDLECRVSKGVYPDRRSGLRLVLEIHRPSHEPMVAGLDSHLSSWSLYQDENEWGPYSSNPNYGKLRAHRLDSYLSYYAGFVQLRHDHKALPPSVPTRWSGQEPLLVDNVVATTQEWLSAV